MTKREEPIQDTLPFTGVSTRRPTTLSFDPVTDVATPWPLRKAPITDVIDFEAGSAIVAGWGAGAVFPVRYDDALSPNELRIVGPDDDVKVIIRVTK